MQLQSEFQDLDAVQVQSDLSCCQMLQEASLTAAAEQGSRRASWSS